MKKESPATLDLCLRGEKLLNQKRVLSARKQFTRAIQLNRKDDRAWQGLGRTWRYSNLKAATACFARAERLNPDDVFNQAYLANALWCCEKNAKARIHYHKALKLNGLARRWLNQFEARLKYEATERQRFNAIEIRARRRCTADQARLLAYEYLNLDLALSASRWAEKWIKLERSAESYLVAGRALSHIDTPRALKYLKAAVKTGRDSTEARSARKLLKKLRN